MIKRSLLLLALLPAMLCAQDLPEGAKKYAPVLKERLVAKWPEIKTRSSIAGQVEQESCINLKHKKCWNPTAELKTDREYGFGLGQITIAYNKDGTERFNNFKELKKLDKDLSSWKWENRFDVGSQFLALIALDKSLYSKLPTPILGEDNRLAFVLAAYNGGLGGTLQDRRLCTAQLGCNPNIWFYNVELYSMKQKTKIKGYGKSFFDINREYPKNILQTRRQKYSLIMD